MHFSGQPGIADELQAIFLTGPIDPHQFEADGCGDSLYGLSLGKNRAFP